MENAHPSLFAREDTFFGVCEALGEDFGFNAQYLRLALAVALFFNPVAVLVGYLAAGVVVAVSRWLAPNPFVPVAQPAAEIADEPEPLPIAA